MCVPPAAKSFFFKLHSGTLPVKPWLREKGIFVLWFVDILRCKTPQTIVHIFIHCSDAVVFWDILQRTLKKKTLTQHTIRYLRVEKSDNVACDVFILLGLFSILKTRMEFQHVDPKSKSAHEHFLDVVAEVVCILPNCRNCTGLGALV